MDQRRPFHIIHVIASLSGLKLPLKLRRRTLILLLHCLLSCIPYTTLCDVMRYPLQKYSPPVTLPLQVGMHDASAKNRLRHDPQEIRKLISVHVQRHWQRRRKHTTSTKSVSNMPARCSTLWSRGVNHVIAKISLCGMGGVPDYYSCWEGYRPER